MKKCPRCEKYLTLIDVIYGESSSGVIGIPYLTKKYGCANCGYSPHSRDQSGEGPE